METQDFFPYRLARLAEVVDRAIAPVYAQRFGLSRDQWRVLAELAQRGPMRTADLIASTALDKMQVSRVLAEMEAQALVERKPDPADARVRIVRPLASARGLYRKIEPMTQAREAFLLDALDANERRMLFGAIDKLIARAEQLQRQG